MDITRLAYLYVSYIEPMLKILFFAMIVVAVLYIFNAVKDGKKNAELINTVFGYMLKGLVKLFTYAGLALLWIGKVLLKILKIIFASIRDFFTSKI